MATLPKIQPYSTAMTEESDRALKVIMRTGMSKSDAGRWAMEIVAGMLDHAWATRVVPEGQIPRIMATYLPPLNDKQISFVHRSYRPELPHQTRQQ
jgi:hypothetical protein